VLRAREKRGKGKGARNSAQDDDVRRCSCSAGFQPAFLSRGERKQIRPRRDLLFLGDAAVWAQSEDTKKIFTPGVGFTQVPVGVKKNRLR
jgi:hypothetical protein